MKLNEVLAQKSMFTVDELEFLNLLLDKGETDSTILTADAALQQRIQSQPLLEWKALNV